MIVQALFEYAAALGEWAFRTADTRVLPLSFWSSTQIPQEPFLDDISLSSLYDLMTQICPVSGNNSWIKILLAQAEGALGQV